MHCPTSLHWQPVKRLLHYLKQTASWSSTQMLWFNTLQTFSGADWAGCHDDRCLTGDFVFFLVIILFPGIVKKQKTVARSNIELSTRLLRMQLLKLIGYVLFYMRLVPLYLGLQFYGVITLVQLIYLPILSSILVQSTMRLIFILLGIWLLMANSSFIFCLVKIN